MSEGIRESLIVALQELSEQIRSTWALIFAIIYIGGALFVSGLVIFFGDGWRTYTDAIPDEGRDALSRQMLSSITDDALLADFILDVPMVLFILFGLGIYVVPFLIFIMGFNVISSEISVRSIRYDLLRCRRWSYYLGKLAAHQLIYAVILAMTFAAVLIFAKTKGGESFDMGVGIKYGLRFWSISLLYGASFVALTVTFSTFFSRPVASLLLSFLAFFVLFIMSKIAFVQYISPFYYEETLFHPLSSELAKGLIAYTILAVLAVAGGLFNIQRRDV